MKKTKEGISVIALMCSVAIILILLTTVTVSGLDTAHNAKKIAFGSEIKMIQGAVDAYYTKNNATYPVKEKAFELNFENDNSKNKKIFQDNEGEEKTAFTTYEIDYDLIGLSDLTYGNKKESNENDVYVLSRASGKVYYLNGLEIGGQTYYTVTDDIENLLSYNNEKNTVNSPVIKFIPSTTNWTNESIEVEIKIPSTCTLNSVLFNNTQKTLANSKLTITENGTLTVKYVENIAPSDIKEAQYIVSNIDNIAPVLSFQEKMVAIPKDGNIGYINISKKEDKLSGIKEVKYDYGDATEMNEYFKSSGIKLNDDVILVKNYEEKITVYTEDNAGNVVEVVIRVEDGTDKVLIDKKIENATLTNKKTLKSTTSESSASSTFLGLGTRSNITKIKILSSKSIAPSTAIDVSSTSDKSIVAWLNGTEVSIASDYVICTNSSSKNLFGYMTNLKEIEGLELLNTSNTTVMWNMFRECSSLTTLDLSKFDTTKVSDMDYMFSNCSSLKTIYVSEKFTTNQLNYSSNMFSGCTSIVGGNGTVYNSSYIKNQYGRIDTSSTPGYFTLKK